MHSTVPEDMNYVSHAELQKWILLEVLIIRKEKSTLGNWNYMCKRSIPIILLGHLIMHDLKIDLISKFPGFHKNKVRKVIVGTKVLEAVVLLGGGCNQKQSWDNLYPEKTFTHGEVWHFMTYLYSCSQGWYRTWSNHLSVSHLWERRKEKQRPSTWYPELPRPQRKYRIPSYRPHQKYLSFVTIN